MEIFDIFDITDIKDIIVSKLDGISNCIFSRTCKKYYQRTDINSNAILHYSSKHGYLSLFIYSIFNKNHVLMLRNRMLPYIVSKNHKHIIKWILDNNILTHIHIFECSVKLSNLKIIKFVYNHRLQSHLHCGFRRDITNKIIENDDIKILKWVYKKRLNLFNWENEDKLNNPWDIEIHERLYREHRLNILRWMVKINPPQNIKALLNITYSCDSISLWLSTRL